MKSLLPAIAFLALSTSAFGNTITLNCVPSGGSGILGSAPGVQTLLFNGGIGSGSFACTDSSLGAIVLTSESINITTDYTAGNGSNTDPTGNSAGFTFSNAATTWAAAHAGAFTTTMALSSAPGITLFTIGNHSSNASTFT